MHPRVLFAFLLVLTGLSFNKVSGQAPTFQQGSPQHKGDAKIRSILEIPKTVVLDVSVLDKKGQPVQGLTEKDFTVLEDGQKVDISSFVPVEADSTLYDGKADRPRLVLVFDTMRTGYQDAARVRGAISSYLRRNGGVLDQPTMLLAVTQQGLVVLHDYTRDGNVLNASLKKLPGHLNQPYYQVSDRSNKVGEYQGDYVILKQIAESLNHVPGHKTVVWIGSAQLWNSPGRRANLLISGLLFESRITLSTLFPKSYLQYLDRGPVGAWDVSGYEDAYKTELKQVSEGGSVAAGSALAPLAFETGGMNLFGGNLVDRELDRTVAAASRFYTIAYSPRDGTNANAAFHKITVELKRSGLTVYARKGYYGIPSAAVASIPFGTLLKTSP